MKVIHYTITGPKRLFSSTNLSTEQFQLFFYEKWFIFFLQCRISEYFLYVRCGVYGIWCTSQVSKCCSFVSEAFIFHSGAARLLHRGVLIEPWKHCLLIWSVISVQAIHLKIQYCIFSFFLQIRLSELRCWSCILYCFCLYCLTNTSLTHTLI